MDNKSEKKKLVAPLLITAILIGRSTTTFLDSIDGNQTWKIVLSAVGVITFFTLGIVIMLKLKKLNNLKD